MVTGTLAMHVWSPHQVGSITNWVIVKCQAQSELHNVL